VKLLWHGTSTADPKNIYKGKDDGLDMRYGGDNAKWGKAIYFAVKAS